MDLTQLLIVQCLVMATVLLVCAVLLHRHGLLHWSSAGFWAWASLVLYFVLAPLSSLIQGSTDPYALNLSIGGGLSRAEWIAFVTIAGISIFFLVYFRTKPSVVTWGLADAEELTLSLPVRVLLGFFLLVGLYSLLAYRAGVLPAPAAVVTNGRNTGAATGYQVTAHLFMFVPIAFLLLSGSPRWRAAGWILAGVYVLLGSLDPFGRAFEVSMLILLSLVYVGRRSKPWPPASLIVAAVFAAILLGARGHTTFQSPQDAIDLATQTPARTVDVLASQNAGMLANWYLKSYVDDTLVGYDYGLVPLNYALTGFLPNQFFPNKYFLVDWLHTQQPPVTSLVIVDALFGQKWSLIGGFYTDGGLIGVVLLMALSGFLSRKLDAMVRREAPVLVRATGLVWMSLLWMVWASDGGWAILNLGSLAIPSLALWLVLPKRRRQRVLYQPRREQLQRP